MNITGPILPGASIGVVGGGQLGRYLVLVARRLGYVTWVLDPDPTAPAMQVADYPLVAAYDDNQALDKLALACDGVTIEFENVPSSSLARLASQTRIAPKADAVRIAQDRRLEKKTAHMYGLKTVAYAVIEASADIEMALKQVPLPGILKTAMLGYDGKGQYRCDTQTDLRAAFDILGRVPCVFEQCIDLQCELSVVLARSHDGKSVCFPVAENVHTNGILDTTTVPASVSTERQMHAQQLAVALADGLQYQGVLALEFFVDGDEQLIFNEMAPRPHNSGHYTLDATVCCQFEQQLRALCALPLGSTKLLSPVTMLNILGECWQAGDPDWLSIMYQSGAHLHIYGKKEPRIARKMGHINCLAADSDHSLQIATTLSMVLNRAQNHL